MEFETEAFVKPQTEASRLASSDREMINNAIYDSVEIAWKDDPRSPFRLLKAENVAKLGWLRSQMSQHFPERSGTQMLRILDVGCGAGYLANALAQDGHRLVGIDLSAVALMRARSEDETRSVEYIEGNAYGLPTFQEPFDVICIMDVLEHVSDPKRVLKECFQKLRPGGRLYFHTFNRTWLSWLLVIKGVEWFIPETPPNLHVYKLFIRPKELSEMGLQVGFQEFQFTGIRPVPFQRPMLKLLLTRSLDKNFQFETTRSLAVGYLGSAVKP